MIADEVQAHINRTLDRKSEPHPMTTATEQADAFSVAAAITADLSSNHLAKTLLSRRIGGKLTIAQADTVTTLITMLEAQNSTDAKQPHYRSPAEEFPEASRAAANGQRPAPASKPPMDHLPPTAPETPEANGGAQ